MEHNEAPNEVANETHASETPVVEAAAETIIEMPSEVVDHTSPTAHRYELTVIMKPTLDEEARKSQLEQINTLLSRFGAVLEKVDEWGRRRLAYEIQKTSEGYYYILTFSSEPDAPAEIESRIRIMENLLRYLIIRVDG